MFSQSEDVSDDIAKLFYVMLPLVIYKTIKFFLLNEKMTIDL